MQDEEYISKEEADKKGYVKRAAGGYYKKSVLEKYCENGYLNLPGSQFSDEDRKLAGEMLAKDYYLGRYNNLQSVKLFLINIGTTGEVDRESAIFHQERYISAMKSIPYEFWKVVRKVCIEDEELICEKKKLRRTLAGKNSVYLQKMLLILGLERLIKFYLQKNKKSS